MATDLQFDVSVFIGMLLSAALALFGPVVVAVLFHRKTQAPWRAFGVGAATFFISQVVLRLPWQAALGVLLRGRLTDRPWLAFAWLLCSAFTAGLFEETGRYIAFRRFLKTERSFRVGVMFGLGHGGIESILLVGLSLVGSAVVYALVSHGVALPVSAAHHDTIVHQFQSITFPLALLSGFERIAAVCTQVALSLVVLRAVQREKKAWYFAAVGLHTVMDAVSVEAVKQFGPYAGEACIGVLALAGLAFILYARKND